MQFNWLYLYLTSDGRLVDEDGDIVIVNAPRFSTVNEADAWLEEMDIRATCASRYESKP